MRNEFSPRTCWIFAAALRKRAAYSIPDLNENLRDWATQALNFCCCADFVFDGGREGADKTVLVLTIDTAYEKPFEILKISYKMIDTLNHRDILGSFMPCQIERRGVGDIIFFGNTVYAFVLKEISGYICESINKIGRAGVTLRICDALPPGIDG